MHLRSEGNVLPAGDIDFRDLLSTTRPAPLAAAVGGRGAMVRMYTSGTTGRPKGVAIPVLAMATWQLYLELGLHVTEDDVYWCAADPGWAYGLFSAVLAPLAAGRTSILHEDKFTPEATWRVLAEQRVTNFAAAPTVYRALRGTAPSPLVLRKASSAGEPLTPEVNEWSTVAARHQRSRPLRPNRARHGVLQPPPPRAAATVEAGVDGHPAAGMVDGRAAGGRR